MTKRTRINAQEWPKVNLFDHTIEKRSLVEQAGLPFQWFAASKLATPTETTRDLEPVVGRSKNAILVMETF